MNTRLLFSAIALAIASPLAGACSKTSDSADARRWPKPPPSASLVIPAALHIDVEVDGAPAPAIDAARLDTSKPDFSDDEHRAWKLATLLGNPATRPGAVVAATGDKGASLELHTATGPGDAIPVLTLNRRGDVLVGLVTPEDPFPDFHGKGGRLNRPGDPLPRMASPTKLRVYVPSAAGVASSTMGTGTGGGAGNGGGPQIPSGATSLKVVIAGGTTAAWTPDALAAVTSFVVRTDGTAKDAWSLRDAAHQLVGPKARVVAAVDGEGTRAKIDPKDWANPSKTPVLRVNRRGMYKIEWVNKDGTATNDEDVRDVKTIEVAPTG